MAQSIWRMLVAAAVLGLGAAPALAQVAREPVNDCVTTIFRFEPQVDGAVPADVNLCAAADLARLRTIYTPQVIQQVVGASFGFGPPSVQPAGLAGSADGRLSDSTITISPLAASAPATPRWNAWADGRDLYSDYSASAGGLDGPTVSGMAGLDYKLTDRITLGMLLSADDSRLDNSLTNSNSGSYGIGPYLGIVLNDHLVLSANVMGSRVDSDQFWGVLQFDTTRLQAASSVTGYWYAGTVRISPAVSVSWSKDWETESSNFGLPDRTIAVGVATPSLQLGDTIRLSDSATVEPWLGAALDWTFLNRVDVSGGGSNNDPNTDLRLQAGLNFTFAGNAQLAITGEASGLLLDSLDAYSIAANFAIQF